MAEHKSIQGKRLVAALGAAVLGASGLIGVAGAANAASDINFGNIDGDRVGSIIINKHETQNNGTATPDGSENGLESPIAGVTFEAYPINDIDLTTPDGWNDLSDVVLAGCGVADPYTLGPVMTALPTDADGVTSFDELNLGAYLVCETDAPDNVTKMAEPFIVTVPTPYNDGWVYDVNVYPKNMIGQLVKEITPQEGLGLGSAIDFVVKARVPSLAEGESYTHFGVQDTLDARLGNVTVGTVFLGTTELVLGTHYTVNDLGDANDNSNRVELTAAGLALLADNIGEDLAVTFTGVIESLGNGTIENTALGFVNDPNWDEDKATESNEVKTFWGDVTILKTDDSTAGNVLAGAVFEVYAANPAYATTPAECSTVATGSALQVGGNTTFTSGANGVITIDGLFVSDSENDPGKNAQFRCYVIKETQAPAGYVTPTGDDALTAVPVTVGQNAELVYDATIKNSQQEVPELPLTGAQGQVLMIIGGTVVLLFGAGLMVASRRRANN